MLRTAPPQALPPLKRILRYYELRGTLPTQMIQSLIVMLPKNERCERPITLTSTVYRPWCRLRKDLLDQSQLQLPFSMNYDRARPGAHVLHVALARLLRQEVNKARAKHGITVLLDMSTFYDCIDLPTLAVVAHELQYPALPLWFALQLCTGPKAIQAEAELSEFFFTQKGVAAGCPQAPLLAKAYLAPAVQPFVAKFPQINVNGWVDDIGYDLEDDDPDRAATTAIAAWRDLKARLDHIGLRVSAGKTAFITTDQRTTKGLRSRLGPDDPPIAPVMRDLGIDYQAGRFRRIPVLKTRYTRRPSSAASSFGHYDSQASATDFDCTKGAFSRWPCGGLRHKVWRPDTEQSSDKHLASAWGITKGAYSMSSMISMPKDIKIQEIRSSSAMSRPSRPFLMPGPLSKAAHIVQAWDSLQHHLQQQQHPWYQVKGPMAAVIVYMGEWEWQLTEPRTWHRELQDYGPEMTLDLNDHWWKIEATLQQEAAYQRLRRLRQRQHCQRIRNGLDWQIFHKHQRKASKSLLAGRSSTQQSSR